MENNRKPYQLVSLDWKQERTVFSVKGVEIGGDNFNVIAGPCAVETEDQINTIATFLSKKGVKILRGGAYKPRTSPYSFQGLREEGLRYLKEAADRNNMAVITEVMDTNLVEKVYEYTDIFQVGTRNMQNFQLLKALSKTDKPVMLKRGWSSTIEEWLLAAEYLLLGGNPHVILCERGIRTFENSTRNTLDLNAVALIKTLSHLPIFVDPSQATGVRNIVHPMSIASMAAGADGVMIEIHNQPQEALSDGDQSLYFDQFDKILEDLYSLSSLVNKSTDYGKTIKIQG
ncbi:MAG: 3-deoxy-7-phosphoheptulonate synthase [Bacteroidia bacterium]|nr:3-deoxy-7-phosphoheptulonate synthase [Bacteroidia bacterium]MCO5254258.1 3-deoxy-7-phosphoheptulonate synthase [Bacteroidota bacterium]MCZ2129792.1 3-deoxy-7-phosphoheptulonate synthase [Bacteroidia bacterium]